MGADYDQKPRDMIFLGSDSVLGAGNTNYFTWGSISGAIGTKRAPIPHAMVIEELHAQVSAAPGGVETVTMTLVVNGVATAMTVVITGAATYNVTTANPITLAAGDYICIRTVYSGAAAGSQSSATLRGVQT